MEERILVPLDGSALAELALPWADAWASSLNATVELVRVVVPSATDSTSSDDIAEYFDERQLEEAEHSLARASSRFQRTSRIQAHVLVGPPAHTLIHHARAHHFDLVVMTTRGLGGLARALLGSTASAVIRRSGLPVLTVRNDTMLPPTVPQRVLAPVDGSDISLAITPRLQRWAKLLHWQLVLYMAANDQTPADPITMARLEQVAEALEAEQVGVDIEVDRHADPAEAILGFVRTHDVGLVAMSTHGRTGLGRWALGSVTDWVIRHAPVPVLALHPLETGASSLSGPTRPAEAGREPGNPPPRVHLALTLAQSSLIRQALEHLAWSTDRHDGVTDQIRLALQKLDAAMEDALGPDFTPGARDVRGWLR